MPKRIKNTWARSQGLSLRGSAKQSLIMNSFAKYNLLSFIWAVVILWLCLSPSSNFPRLKIPHLDKIVHFAFYFIFALLIFFGWKKQHYFPALHRNILVKILFVAVSYGIAVEIVQHFFTTDRHFEFADILVNATGAFAGCAVSRYFSWKVVCKKFNGKSF